VLKAAAAEINDFDSTLGRVFEQDVLRLEITMDDTMNAHKLKRKEHLVGEPTDQSSRKPNKAICFDKLVEVNAQKLHHNAQVATESEVLVHLDALMLVFGIL
jgi:hypothetical protein